MEKNLCLSSCKETSCTHVTLLAAVMLNLNCTSVNCLVSHWNIMYSLSTIFWTVIFLQCTKPYFLYHNSHQELKLTPLIGFKLPLISMSLIITWFYLGPSLLLNRNAFVMLVNKILTLFRCLRYGLAILHLCPCRRSLHMLAVLQLHGEVRGDAYVPHMWAFSVRCPSSCLNAHVMTTSDLSCSWQTTRSQQMITVEYLS
jgi:hypothetical protein